jgi:NAD(P)-dependent dehydrogenase (short-subunit alcohol dehydrogenase family)
MMRILITRFRDGSLGHYIREYLTFNNGAAFHDIDMMDRNLEFAGSYDLGSYDRIINVAGITLNQPVIEYDFDQSRRVFKTNVLDAALLTSMYANKRVVNGAIIHISSIGARKNMTNCSMYCASKAALDAYIRCAGYELKGNIAVIGFNPPNIAGTPMTERIKEDLKINRGMSQEQVDNIYKDAANPSTVASVICRHVLSPMAGLHLMSGENIYMGKGDHR